MNVDQLTSEWEQIKDSLKETWSDLTDEDLDKMKGSYQEAVGYLQEKYGQAKKAIEEQLSPLMNKFKSNEDEDNDNDNDEDNGTGTY
jgi:uncharacterized protein YjbJ (UPF0337 family)